MFRRHLGRFAVLAALGVASPVELPAQTESSPPPPNSGRRDEDRSPAPDRTARRPLSVLLVAASPTWQYRYVKNALLRLDQARVRTQCWLVSSGETFEQEHSPALPALRALPARDAELWTYDVILLEGLDRDDLGPRGPGDRWLDQLEQFVAFGGGLAVLAADGTDHACWRGTILERVLPARFLTAEERRDEPDTRQAKPYHAIPTAAHAVVDLRRPRRTPRDTAEPEAISSLRTDWQALPALRTWHPVIATHRPGSTIVLRHERARLGEQAAPLCVVGTWQRGRALVFASADSWSWQRGGPERFDRFWDNVVTWLAGGTRWAPDERVGPGRAPRAGRETKTTRTRSNRSR